MSKQLFINGYELTNIAKELPTIDISIPEWGQVENKLFNDIIDFKISIRFASFFRSATPSNMSVKLLQNGITVFDGKIDKIDSDDRYMYITAKSNSTIILTRNIINFTMSDAYPADILLQILEYSELTFNLQSYNNSLALNKLYLTKFNVTLTSGSYSSIITDLAKASCAKVYMYNNEVFFELYNPNRVKSSITLSDTHWVEYPKITEKPAYNSRFDEINVKYSSGILIKDIQDASEVIDISTSSVVSSSSPVVASHIANLYDSLGTNRKYLLEGKLRTEVLNSKIEFNIEWGNRIYSITHLGQDSEVFNEIIAENLIKREALISGSTKNSEIDGYKTIYIPSDNLTRRFPAHHWRLNSIISAYGTTYGDDTGSYSNIMEETNCVDSAVTHIAGGRSWLFDGASAYGLSLQDCDATEGDWSAGAWIYPTDTPFGGIISTQSTHAWGGFTYPDIFCATSNNQILLYMDYNNILTIITFATAPINNIYHVMMTIKKTDYYIAAGIKWLVTLYVDGVERGRDFMDYDIPKTNIRIGRTNRDASNYWFTGNMQDVRVYDYALTLTEIQNIYNGSGSGLGTFEDIIKL